MNIILKQETHKASKEYICDACSYILSNWGESCFYDLPLTSDEKESVDKAKNNNWKIKKGQLYLYSVQIYDGQFVTLKGIPQIVNICQKYDLWDD